MSHSRKNPLNDASQNDTTQNSTHTVNEQETSARRGTGYQSLLGDKFSYNAQNWLVSIVYDTSTNTIASLNAAFGYKNQRTRLLIEGASSNDGHPIAYLYSLIKSRQDFLIGSTISAPYKQIVQPADYYYQSFTISAKEAQKLIEAIEQAREDNSLDAVHSDDSDDDKEGTLANNKVVAPELSFFALSKNRHHINFEQSGYNWVREKILSVQPTADIQKSLVFFQRDAYHGSNESSKKPGL